jgi:hypothetical protein
MAKTFSCKFILIIELWIKPAVKNLLTNLNVVLVVILVAQKAIETNIYKLVTDSFVRKISAETDS